MTEPDDPGRTEPAFDLPDERTMLAAYLDYHRATLLMKASGLTQAQLAQTLASSSLTLGGLLKHMALVEDSWFTERFAGQPMPPPFDAVDWDADPDWEFRTRGRRLPRVAARSATRRRATAVRAVTAAAASLDQRSVVGRPRQR